MGCIVLSLLFLRTRTEEEKLIERFGADYRLYMERTGRFLPRLCLTAAVAMAVLAAASVGAVQGPDSSTAVTPAKANPLITGLDHIPIAVRNLEAAIARFRALGFTLKPGRPHENGIRNQHAKFADGTELELITAPEARDPLTTYYVQHLDGGDGPAFVAFYAPETDSVVEQLEDTHKPYRSGVGLVTFPDEDSLRYIFFGRRNASPNDRPQHFAHPNGAESLMGVWLAGDDFSAERRLWDRLRLTVSEEEVRAPDPIRVPVVHLPAGEILLLPGSRQVVPDRKVVGATIRVRNLAATRRTLLRGRLKVPPTVETKGGSSIFLPPTATHGIWLEFREQR